MSLDEKIIEDNDYYKYGWIQVEDVKQFIKELKEEINDHQFHMIIDALAGKGLI